MTSVVAGCDRHSHYSLREQPVRDCYASHDGVAADEAYRELADASVGE